MARILAVDDEISILEIIRKGLEKDGHQVTCITNPTELKMEQLKFYDLLLLDIMMQGIDGYTLCEKIRNMVDCPIIFLTAKTLEKDITYGLAIGADDYLMKPFRIAELRARIQAHLRREQREHRHMLCFGDIEIDLDAKDIYVAGKTVSFTKSEYMICEYLAQNKEQVFSREQIYEAVFDVFGESDNSTITTHIMNIRNKFQKFQKQPIQTVWGIGYRWKLDK